MITLGSKMKTLNNFETKHASIAVIGLGYVGLPLAVEFNTKYRVLGFDINQTRIDELKAGLDRSGEADMSIVDKNNMSFTCDENDLKSANIYIVTVPTPIDSHNRPDLTLVSKASELVSRQLSAGDIVIFESTVYPGVTEDICGKIIEEKSGLKLNQDFFLGYSPERLSPGEKERTLTKVVKVVSGSTPEVASLLAELYGSIIPAGIHEATSIKVAEAAKIIENTQRDLNVALMNELSIIFSKLGISTLDVIDTAATKWNFMKMTPGLVGGHCIGVDPYYLTYLAEQLGYHPQVILAGRRINDNMGKHIASETIKKIIQGNKNVKGAKVLIMGLTFKENVSDIRNSKVVDIVNELHEYGVQTYIIDPHANPQETFEEYGLTLENESNIPEIDAVVLSVAHTEYRELSLEKILAKIAGPQDEKVVIDIKGILRADPLRHDCLYWEL
jgi:UDP-N-acetyl-D-galactosamine dehydrogenase